MILLKSIQEIVSQGRQYFTVHAQEQMAVRKIRSAEITEAILSKEADIIEQYPEDKYSPSCLIYGVTGLGTVLHVQSNYKAVIITIYEPDLKKWEEGFKIRRKNYGMPSLS